MNRFSILVCTALLPSAPLAMAATAVFSDDFSRATLLPYDYAGGAAGNDYTATPGTTSTTGATAAITSNALTITDTGAGQYAQNVLATEFSPYTLTTGDIVSVNFDVRVNSFIAANAASTFRFGIYDGGVNNGQNKLSVGWGYANIADGDASTTDLFFYATTNVGTTPTAANSAIIGFNGSGWDAGFDFGNYNSASAVSNDTGGYYNVSMSFTQGSTAMTGVITNLSNTSQTASFSRTLGVAFDWSTNDAQDGINVLSGLGGTGTFDLDNLQVLVPTPVPEPGSLTLGALALCSLLRRRR